MGPSDLSVLTREELYEYCTKLETKIKEYEKLISSLHQFLDFSQQLINSRAPL